MANVNIDNSGNVFPGTVSIADLARFTFEDLNSDDMAIYFVDGVFDGQWKGEIETKEHEYGVGVSVLFKDGSRLHVSAYGEVACDDYGRSERHAYDAGARYSRSY